MLIALTCAYSWKQLAPRVQRVPAQFWVRLFFGMMGASALVGAVFGHLFYYKAGFTGKFISWSLSILSLAAMAQAALAHKRQYEPDAPGHPWLSGLNLALMLLAVGISGFRREFHWVEAHSAIAMVGFVAPIEIYLLRKYKASGSNLLLWSLPVAVLAVLPHVFKWSPSVWFTYFDVGHLILCVSLWLILRGAIRLAPEGV